MEDQAKEEFQPILQPRKCGGWLAISPLDAFLRIGVTGNTEDEARESFHRSLERWIELLTTLPTEGEAQPYKSNMSDAMNLEPLNVDSIPGEKDT